MDVWRREGGEGVGRVGGPQGEGHELVVIRHIQQEDGHGRAHLRKSGRQRGEGEGKSAKNGRDRSAESGEHSKSKTKNTKIQESRRERCHGPNKKLNKTFKEYCYHNLSLFCNRLLIYARLNSKLKLK